MTLDEIRTLFEHGNVPMSDVLRDLADTKLPEIDGLIERAQRVRQTIDACALFDDAPIAKPIGVAQPPGA